MYLYTGARGTLRRYGTAAGNFDAKNIMKLWASLLPEGTMLRADLFFWVPRPRKGIGRQQAGIPHDDEEVHVRRDMGRGAGAGGADGGMRCC